MKTKTMHKTRYVIWKDSFGVDHYDSFKTDTQARDFMLSKLSSGLWACISENVTIHKAPARGAFRY